MPDDAVHANTESSGRGWGFFGIRLGEVEGTGRSRAWAIGDMEADHGHFDGRWRGHISGSPGAESISLRSVRTACMEPR